MKNKYRHNPDGSTTIFIESRKHGTKECLIDTDDFEKLSEEYPGTWWLSLHYTTKSRFYSYTNILHPDGGVRIRRDGRSERRRTHRSLHHGIMGKPAKGRVTDHINGNGLDNRKENLRFVTPTVNSQNKRKQSNNTYGYVGVRKAKKTSCYSCAYITENNRQIHLGTFKTKEEAAQAYDLAVVESRGIVNPKNQLNFPEKLKEYEALLATKNKCENKKNKKQGQKIRGHSSAFCLRNKDINGNIENILTNEALMLIIRVNSLRYAGLIWEDVAAELNESGIMNSRGKPWKKNAIRKTTLALRNEFDLTWPPDSPYSSMGD